MKAVKVPYNWRQIITFHNLMGNVERAVVTDGPKFGFRFSNFIKNVKNRIPKPRPEGHYNSATHMANGKPIRRHHV